MSFNAGDFQFNIDTIEARIMREIEEKMIRYTEMVEGHVPSNEEITEHGRRYYMQSTGATFFTWRNVILFGWKWTENGFAWLTPEQFPDFRK